MVCGSQMYFQRSQVQKTAPRHVIFLNKILYQETGAIANPFPRKSGARQRRAPQRSPGLYRPAPARKRGGAGAAVIWPSASPSRPWRPSAPHSQTARAVWEPCVFHLHGRSESARHQDVRSANMLGAAGRRLAPARKRGGAGAAVIWPSAFPSRPWRPSAPPLFCCGPFPGRWAGR